MSIVITHGYWMLMGSRMFKGFIPFSYVISSSSLSHDQPRSSCQVPGLQGEISGTHKGLQLDLLAIWSKNLGFDHLSKVSRWMYWLGYNNAVWFVSVQSHCGLNLRSQRSHCNGGAGPVKEILKWCFQIVWEDDLLQRRAPSVQSACRLKDLNHLESIIHIGLCCT